MIRNVMQDTIAELVVLFLTLLVIQMVLEIFANQVSIVLQDHLLQ